MTRAGVPIGPQRGEGPDHPLLQGIGLLASPPRTNTNRRHYNAGDLRRLVFIRRARQLGFEIDAIRALLTIQDNLDQSCEAVDDIARARLREVERRIEDLMRLKARCRGQIVYVRTVIRGSPMPWWGMVRRCGVYLQSNERDELGCRIQHTAV